MAETCEEYSFFIFASCEPLKEWEREREKKAEFCICVESIAIIEILSQYIVSTSPIQNLVQ